MRPLWIRTALPAGPEFEQVNRRLTTHGLATVCTHARCPNLADCWARGTATFMLLGDTCTRACRFGSVATGNPQGAVDESEPERVAAAVAELGLRYVVLTSVDRDDLIDNGAGIFARTIVQVRMQSAECRMQNDGRPSTTDGNPLECHPERPEEVEGSRLRDSRNCVERSTTALRSAQNDGQRSAVSGKPVLVEVLVPDFSGREDLIAKVLGAGPDVFGHNVETVERLSPKVRDSRASYRRSLEVLATAKRLALDTTTKSGLMVGLGETDGEVEQTMEDLRSAGCDIITIGQYLQPARECLAVERYVEPLQFDRWREQALGLGFRAAYCGPMVRSSFHAEEVLADSEFTAKSAKMRHARENAQ